MKTTRQIKRKEYTTTYQFTYDCFPQEGEKQAMIEEWGNGEGFDVYFGGDKIELSNQEITVLEILFAQTRLIK